MTTTTFDPATKNATVVLSNGNLTATASATTNYHSVKSTDTKSSGKWYAEFTNTASDTNNNFIGLAQTTTSVADGFWIGNSVDSWSYFANDGNKFHSGAGVAYGSSYTSGDIISVLFDAGAGSLSFWKNGVDQGVAYSGIAAGSYLIEVTLYSGTTSANVVANFGDQAFAYTMPAGYGAWSGSAPAPTVGAIDATLPQLTFSGSRVASMAVVMEPFAVPKEDIAGAMEELVFAATGRSENAVATTMEPLEFTATGYSSSINTIALTAPAPVLSSTILTGDILSIVVSAPVPLLVATIDNPAIITFAGSAPVPRLVSIGLTGTVATVLITAPAPTMAAAGYPAYTITFAGTAPVPTLSSELSAAITENYRTWVLNTRKLALTEYDNFSFNSFATFNGYVLAAGSSGIVTLGTQDLDNATAITARVRSGKDSFKSSFHKRVPRAYIGHNADGDLYFRMITTEGGTRTYLLGWNNATGLQQRRIPIGKGPKSRYWQWEVENIAGADFDIDNVLFYPTKLRRRV